MTINVKILDIALKGAGIPFVGCDELGNIEFLPEATAAQRTQAAQILAAHDPIDYDLQKQQAAIGELKTLTILAGKTDAQISTWVDSNVTDLASVKAAIKLLARAVGALARDRGVV